MPGVTPLHAGGPGVVALPLSVGVLAAAALLPWVLAGAQRAGARRWLWSCGVAVVAVAVLPPLDHLAEASLAVHMVQHVLLLFVAAPLLVAGEQLTAAVRSLPRTVRARTAVSVSRLRRWMHRPTGVTAVGVLHAAVVLLWHVPVAYEAAVGSAVLHATEHGQFLGLGSLFWWSVREVARRRRPVEMAAGVCGLAVVVVSGVAVGLFMTFSVRPWYTIYAGVPEWGLTALADQQAAGAVMWGVGGPAYLLAALLLFSAAVRDRTGPDEALRPPTSSAAP